MATKADRYEGIDGLKAYAIIGIALMHVLSNGKYEIGGYYTLYTAWWLLKIEDLLICRGLTFSLRYLM